MIWKSFTIRQASTGPSRRETQLFGQAAAAKMAAFPGPFALEQVAHLYQWCPHQSSFLSARHRDVTYYGKPQPAREIIDLHIGARIKPARGPRRLAYPPTTDQRGGQSDEQIRR